MNLSIIHGFVLGLIASPSCPSNTEEIRQGTRYGLRGALSVGLGAVAGDAAVLAVLVLGVLPLLERAEGLTLALWLVGAFVLAYVAWGIFREAAIVTEAPAVDTGVKAPRSALARAFWLGFAITAFNPFTILWWLGLLGPVLAQGTSVPLGFSLAVLIGALSWFLALASILHWARQWLTVRLRRLVLMASGIVASGYALYFLWRAFSTILGQG